MLGILNKIEEDEQMDFPQRLRNQIETLFMGEKTSRLSQNFKELSGRYRGERSASQRLLEAEDDALVYAAVRMPATFGAVASALERVLERTSLLFKTMLDVGAGTGASGWAANELIALEKLICLEREPVMRNLGRRLMMNSGELVLEQAQWREFDLLKNKPEGQFDLVTASYVLNELPESACDAVVLNLWQATEKVLLLVEPGTPNAFQRLLKTRDFLLSQGAYVMAPCPHALKCSLKGSDWCHFSTRISRSRLHKQLKFAVMGYEDEKFCYMAFCREAPEKISGRFLREPEISKAGVKCHVCQCDGSCDVLNVSAKNKDDFKRLKKAKWGDVWMSSAD